MEKAKQLWTLAKANPKISAAVVVVIVVYLFFSKLGLLCCMAYLERKHSCHVCAGKKRISI